MEFTVTRTAMCICAVILMAAVAGPVTGVFEDREDEMYASSGGSLTEVIDGFGAGEADSMVLDLALYLPSGSSVTFEGDRMVMETPDGEFTYLLHTSVEGDGSYGCSGLVKLMKTDGSVTAERL